MEELYANLSIEEEEEENREEENVMLVGKFMTERNINFQAMQNLLASLWRPKDGMEIHDPGRYCYSFVFYHIMDLRKVIEGRPWSFEQNMLVYKQIEELEDPHLVQLNEMDI